MTNPTKQWQDESERLYPTQVPSYMDDAWESNYLGDQLERQQNFLKGCEFEHGRDKWISVKSEPPKDGFAVLLGGIYYNHWRTVKGFYTNGGVVEFEDQDDDYPECFDEQKQASFLPKGYWSDPADEEKYLPLSDITHWQPLPTAPKSKI